MQELKRILSKKIIIIFFSAFVLNLLLFTYSQMSGKSMNDFYSDNKYYISLINEYKVYDLNDAKERVTSLYQNIKNDNQQGNLNEVRNLLLKIRYLEKYKSNIDEIINKSNQLQNYSLFSDELSFSYNNIIKTGQDFSKVKNISVELDNDRAVESTVEYYYIFYISFALVVIIIYELLKERDTNMWVIVYSSKLGRFALACKRIILVTIIYTVINMLLYAQTFIISLILYGGISDLNNPIQTLIRFGKCALPYSKIEYLIYNFLISNFIMIMISMILLFIFTLFRNRKYALTVVCLFVGVEILLYNAISIQSIYGFFHNVNIINLFGMNMILCSYNNSGIGTFVVSYTNLIIFAMLCLGIISGIASTIVYSKMRPYKKPSLLSRVLGSLRKISQTILYYEPQSMKEIHKIIITRKGLRVLVIAAILCLFFSCNGRVTYLEDAQEKDNIYLNDGGSEYGSIIKMIDEAVENYNIALQNYKDIEKQVDDGTLEVNRLAESAKYLEYEKNNLAFVSEFNQKKNYLEELKKEKNIDGYMMSDRGYEQIIGRYGKNREIIVLLIVLITIVIVVSDNISYEYTSGMNKIIHSAYKGRGWIYWRKIYAIYLLISVFFIVIYGIKSLILNNYYGCPYLDAPIQSLSFMKECTWKISILQWMIINMITRLLMCYTAASITIFISTLRINKQNQYILAGSIAGIAAIALLVTELEEIWQIISIIVMLLMTVILLLYSYIGWKIRRN